MRKSFILLAALLSVALLATATLGDSNLPEKKQTALGLYINSRQAYTMWKNDPINVVIIDCRTPEEYVFVGHPDMAYNIPSKLITDEYDPAKNFYKMIDNPDFVKQINKRFKKNQPLMIMCRSGSRSASGVNSLAKAGFTNVYSIVDGFEGDMIKDENSYFTGQRMINGWKNSGNPWTYACDKSLMYFATKSK